MVEDQKTTVEPVGKVLFDAWMARDRHGRSGDCPGCGGPTWTIGITKLAYTFEPCSCDQADFEHLVETMWHRACLVPIFCPEFVPWSDMKGWKKDKPVPPDCMACGRAESAHEDGRKSSDES